VAKSAKRVLVITEGLVVYLDPEVVSSLAKDLARPPFQFWILDFASSGGLQIMNRSNARFLQNAPMKFSADEGVDYFAQRGWKHREVKSLFVEAARLGRLPMLMRLLALLPQPDMVHGKKGGRWSALVRLERA